MSCVKSAFAEMATDAPWAWPLKELNCPKYGSRLSDICRTVSHQDVIRALCWRQPKIAAVGRPMDPRSSPWEYFLKSNSSKHSSHSTRLHPSSRSVFLFSPVLCTTIVPYMSHSPLFQKKSGQNLSKPGGCTLETLDDYAD